MTIKAENKLTSPIGIHKFQLNNTKYYEINQDQDWVQTLLRELNEKAEDQTPEEFLSHTYLNIELEVEKKHQRDTGEFVLIRGKFETKYATQCVRTLEDMYQQIDYEFKAAMLSEECSQMEQFQDQSEAFLDNDMYEIYFFEKNLLNIHDVVHEMIFLNINQYPVKDPDAPLPDRGTKH